MYEGPELTTISSLQTWADILNRMATDNLAKEISVSYGLAEDLIPNSVATAEDQALKQMSMQGQSVFIASGDSGAYTDPFQPTVVEVSDPASDPFATAVGGTTLTVNSDGTYKSETTWATIHSRH